jgi:hypothetical protein
MSSSVKIDRMLVEMSKDCWVLVESVIAVGASGSGSLVYLRGGASVFVGLSVADVMARLQGGESP